MYTKEQVTEAFKSIVIDYPTSIEEEEWNKYEFPKLLKRFLEILDNIEEIDAIGK